MKLTDDQLLAYVQAKLALPGEKRNEYRAQVTRLLETLELVLSADGSYQIVKFRRAGSLEKGTSNRPRAGKPVDADVGVYFNADPRSFDIASLQRLIKKLLAAAYPQKSSDDFEEGGRTFGVVFKASGLEVDLVPIVALDKNADIGVQCSRTGERVTTDIKAHIAHYRNYAASDPLLAPLLRLTKRWRYWQELAGIQSFHLELVLSYLVDRDGPVTGVEEGLRRFFLFVARDLPKGIAFGDGTASSHKAPVVIIDPANSANNVAGRIQGVERDAFVVAAKEGLTTLTVAQGLPGKGETITAWKTLFGDNFAIE